MKEKSFEESLVLLEQIVSSMESGNLPLEESIKKYEEGIKLARFCKERLERAEKKVEILLKQADGSFVIEEFEKSTAAGEKTDTQSSSQGGHPEGINASADIAETNEVPPVSSSSSATMPTSDGNSIPDKSNTTGEEENSEKKSKTEEKIRTVSPSPKKLSESNEELLF